MIFVNSMSDLFHPDVPDRFIVQVAETMRIARWHTYQVLTKRPERLKRMLNGPLREAAEEKHIWWGVSVENRKHGVPRIAYLQDTPAAVRFLSVEPLLEDVGTLPLDGISWVIVGGESGPGARPMEESWVVSIQKQCKGAGVPFFFKQWGGVRKKVHGRILRGRTHDSFPKRVRNPALPATVRLQRALEIERSALVQIAMA
jgi:protein gp37